MRTSWRTHTDAAVELVDLWAGQRRRGEHHELLVPPGVDLRAPGEGVGSSAGDMARREQELQRRAAEVRMGGPPQFMRLLL